MRHRIVSGTGLGNPEPVILDNRGQLDTDFSAEAYDSYFTQYEGFDYNIDGDLSVSIGVEPAYQYEKLKIIHINKDIEKSYIETGKAWGPYGSQIGKNKKMYSDYKRNCKFTRFVNKWHLILFK